MSQFRTRLITLRHKIAAHSMTDSGPVLDAYHFFNVASSILTKMFAAFGSKVNHKEHEKFRFVIPSFYYNNCKIDKGVDDDIIDGSIIVSGKDYLFPEIFFEIDIKNREMQRPERFKFRGKEYAFDLEMIKKFFREIGPIYQVDSESTYPYPTLSGAKVPTVYFGDQSKTREDLMLPIETGDQAMMGRSTGPYVGM